MKNHQKTLSAFSCIVFVRFFFIIIDFISILSNYECLWRNNQQIKQAEKAEEAAAAKKISTKVVRVPF